MTTLSADSPYLQRIAAWLNERFPPLVYGILIICYYSSNQFLAKALTHPGKPMFYNINSLLGAVTMFLFFFHLRVFDEHKDYKDDCRHYPDRILSRGIVTLRELRLLGWIAVAIELTLASFAGIGPLIAWATAMGFSLIMLKEFFCSDFLRRHFVVYATTHMLITPLLGAMTFSFATGMFFWNAPPWYWVYAFVGFFVAFNWEISRKIRTPDDEIDGVDTYSAVFGTYGAANMVLGVRVIDTMMVAAVGMHLGLNLTFYCAIIGLFCVCLVGYFQYRMNTCRKTAKRLETYAGMYIIAFDLILAVEIIRKLGFEL